MTKRGEPALGADFRAWLRAALAETNPGTGRRWTYEALSAASGVGVGHISEIVRGGKTPSLDTIDRIRVALGRPALSPIVAACRDIGTPRQSELLLAAAAYIAGLEDDQAARVDVAGLVAGLTEPTS